jgi:hypothetical protein
MHYFSCSGGTGTDSTESVRTRYAELVFLHPVVFVGHVVHFDVSVVQNVDALFSLSGGLSAVSIKGASGHIMLKLCFYISWDLWVT